MQDDWEKKRTQKSSGKVYLPRYFGSQTTHSQGLISSRISRHSTGLRHRWREEENPEVSLTFTQTTWVEIVCINIKL